AWHPAPSTPPCRRARASGCRAPPTQASRAPPPRGPTGHWRRSSAGSRRGAGRSTRRPGYAHRRRPPGSSACHDSSAGGGTVDGSAGICTESPRVLRRHCTIPPHGRAVTTRRPTTMTDATAPQPNAFRRAFERLSSSSLATRAALLAVLTLLLKIPLSMVDGVIADRQSYESEAINNVRDSWGRAQTFVGPMVFLPYRPANST